MCVTIYTLPTCGKCNVLKAKMNAKGIEFNEVQDTEQMSNMGISEVPVLDVDGKMMDFSEARKWVDGKEE